MEVWETQGKEQAKKGKISSLKKKKKTTTNFLGKKREAVGLMLPLTAAAFCRPDSRKGAYG